MERQVGTQPSQKQVEIGIVADKDKVTALQLPSVIIQFAN